MAFELLASAAPGDEDPRTRKALEGAHGHYGNVPVGRLGVPLDLYARCAAALRERSGNRLTAIMRDYAARAAEVIETASHDHFHWRTLRASILPAEPEAIAALATIAAAAHEQNVSLSGVASDLDSRARLLLEVAIDMSAFARSSLPRPEAHARGTEVEAVRPLIEQLAREYERVRASMPTGAARTRELEEVASRMRALSAAGYPLLPDLIRGGPGERLAAICFLEVNPNAEYLDWLAARIIDEKPFVTYHAAWALRHAGRQLSLATLGLVADAIFRALGAAAGADANTEDVLMQAAEEVANRRRTR